MIYTKLTKKAMNIAYEAHKNQIGKDGIPYIYHPIHLAEQMDTEIECVCALLHDTVEDTDITFEQLEKEFPKEVITVLRLLTHDKNVDYMDYIKNLKENLIAKKIKITDLKHNMDSTRLDTVSTRDETRIKKYKKAILLLEKNKYY